jgi:hypothetical protein
MIELIEDILVRFKWNYFNDIVYSIYFYLLLFSFSQLYEFKNAIVTSFDILSLVLAFLFLVIGIIFIIFVGYLLKTNEK